LDLQTNGTTAISISASQVVTFANQPAYTGGTANGVLYLNASKVLTSGTALVFDGTNLGVGVTPSALDIGRTIQVGFNSNTIWGATANNFQFLAGATYNNAYLYAVTGSAVSNYRQTNGQHQWFNAPSGTAGNTATFTQAMTLDSSANLFVGGTATTTQPALDRGVYLQGTLNNSIIGYSMYINEGSNNRRGSMFLNDNTGVWGWDVTASSGVPIYVFYRAGNDFFHVGDDIVVNDIGADVDFRVESDTNSQAIFLNAQYSNVGINIDPSTAATLFVRDSNASGTSNNSAVSYIEAAQQNKPSVIVQSAATSQGNGNWVTFVKSCPSVSSNNKLIIPFVSQGNLNSTTICKVIGHSAAYNLSTPYGFEITFAVGHLNALYSFTSWGANGNAVSAAVNGMNVEITFTTAYNVAYGVSGGVFVTLQYMSNVVAYSVDVNNVRLN
jgi:hypothetical protein